MPPLRLFVACLLMLALPLQGLAAASMVFCGMGSQGLQHVAAAAAPASADAAAHAYAHAEHTHASPSASGQPADHGAEGPVDFHKCSVCASCSHGAALMDTGWPPAACALEQASLAEPQARILVPLSALPDKPPRA